jgi:hypothetical protein
MELRPEEQKLLEAIEEAESIRQISLEEAEQQVKAGFVSFLGLELERRLFFDDRFSIMVPITFNTVVPNTPIPQLPEVILSDPLSSVTIMLDYGKAAYQNSDVGQSLGQIKTMLKKMNPASRFYKDGVFNLGGKRVEYLEFFNSGEDGEAFNDYFQMSVQGKALYCYFYCATDIARKWRNIFWAITKSAQFK